jgi:hypothetical protein
VEVLAHFLRGMVVTFLTGALAFLGAYKREVSENDSKVGYESYNSIKIASQPANNIIKQDNK